MASDCGNNQQGQYGAAPGEGSLCICIDPWHGYRDRSRAAWRRSSLWSVPRSVTTASRITDVEGVVTWCTFSYETDAW